MADLVIIQMVELNRIHGYLVNKQMTGMMVVNREFIKDCNAWNINICSSLNILVSNRV